MPHLIFPLFTGSAVIFFLSYEAYMILVLLQYESDRDGSSLTGSVTMAIKLLCAIVTGLALVATIVMSELRYS